MKRHLMLGTIFSAALAVGASAQSAGQPPAGQSPTGQDTNRSSNAQTMTVTGCLKADTSSASKEPGAPASPGASSASGGYILEVAPSGAANPASPTESPNPTATSGAANKTFKLTGGSSDLSTMVGKKVEVKGTLQNRAGSAMGSPSESRPDSSAKMPLKPTPKLPSACLSSTRSIPNSSASRKTPLAVRRMLDRSLRRRTTSHGLLPSHVE